MCELSESTWVLIGFTVSYDGGSGQIGNLQVFSSDYVDIFEGFDFLIQGLRHNKVSQVNQANGIGISFCVPNNPIFFQIKKSTS